MNVEELRAQLSGDHLGSDVWVKHDMGTFCQWWWGTFLNSDQRRAMYEINPGNDDIRTDLLTLNDEELMLAWAVFKM